MSQTKNINLDQIRIKKSQQDREQAQDLDDLIEGISNLIKENSELKKRVEELEGKKTDPNWSTKPIEPLP